MANRPQRIRRWILWLTLVWLVILLVLSIVGSVRGSRRAGELFNTPVLVAYWLAFVALLIAGLWAFGRLRRRPGLLLIHLGCAVVLLGSMWSSDRGHALQARLARLAPRFFQEKIPRGYMGIFEDQQHDQVLDEQADEEIGRLPFTLRLEDFWMDYHRGPGTLYVRRGEPADPNAAGPNESGDVGPVDPNGPGPVDPNPFDASNAGREPTYTTWQIPARVGAALALPAPLSRVRVLREIHNLQVGGERVTDRPQDPSNPALEVAVEMADGTGGAAYVFPPGTPHPLRTDGFEFVYEPGAISGIKDYFSDLVVLDYARQVQRRQVIEVNHPLHYGGYHFYQSDFGSHRIDTPRGPQTYWYSLLQVVSDSGVSVVFLGYGLLCLGVFWHCWFRHIAAFFHQRRANAD